MVDVAPKKLSRCFILLISGISHNYQRKNFQGFLRLFPSGYAWSVGTRTTPSDWLVWSAIRSSWLALKLRERSTFHILGYRFSSWDDFRVVLSSMVHLVVTGLYHYSIFLAEFLTSVWVESTLTSRYEDFGIEHHTVLFFRKPLCCNPVADL